METGPSNDSRITVKMIWEDEVTGEKEKS